MKQTREILILLAVPVLVLAGCSSDTDDATRSDVTSTTAAADGGGDEAFAEQVNAICAGTSSAMGEIFGPMSQLDGPPTEEVLQSTYDALLAQLKGEQEAIAALSPPAGMKADWDALVAAHEDGVASVEEQGLAYFDDEETNTFAEVEAMAVEMGFDDCGGQG